MISDLCGCPETPYAYVLKPDTAGGTSTCSDFPESLDVTRLWFLGASAFRSTSGSTDRPARIGPTPTPGLQPGLRDRSNLGHMPTVPGVTISTRHLPHVCPPDLHTLLTTATEHLPAMVDRLRNAHEAL